MKTFTLDLSARGVVPLLYVKQQDMGSKICIELKDNQQQHDIPENTQFSVWYSGKSGSGNYTEIDGRSAFAVEGNKVTVELIYQMLTNPGEHVMCLVMNGADGTQLGLWNIPYFVEEIPGADSEVAEQYYDAFVQAQKKAEDAAQSAEEAAQRAADSATTAARAEQAVGSINPDTLAQMQELLAGAENLSAEAADAAKRAEEAAAELEGGLVLKKGEGIGSVMQTVIPGQGEANTVKANQAFAANTGNMIKETAIHGFASGVTNTINGACAFVAGHSNKVFGLASFACGQANHIEPETDADKVDYSFAAGRMNKILGGESPTVLGYKNQVKGNCVFAVGEGNIVTGQHSAVFGKKNEVTAGSAFVGGYDNVVQSPYAFITGKNNEVTGPAGVFMHGDGLEATKAWQAIFGRYNSTDAKALLIVGNGTAEDARSNAFEVHKDSIVVGGKELNAQKIEELNNGIAASALVDKTYSDMRVKVNYGADTITNPASDNNLAIWQYVNGNELELRSVSLWSIFQYLQNYFYTEDEVDEKFSNVNGGGSAGMIREFQATENGLTTGSTTSWSYSGTKAKYYTLTVQKNILGTTHYHPLTIDYKALNDMGRRAFTVYGADENLIMVEVWKNSSGINFEIVSSGATFTEICGYY